MQTYNQIIKLNRQFAEAHYQIKTFGNGEAYNIVLHDKQDWFNYPLMWMEDLQQAFNDNEFTYNFRVYFVAQVAQLREEETDLENSNENEVKSDMIQCAQDLLSFWAKDTTYPELDLIKTGSIQTFTDKFSDRVTGCSVDLKLKQGFRYNKCAIPMSGVTPPPSVACLPVSVSVNSVSFGEVASGGAFNLNVLFDGTAVGEKVGDDLIVSAEYENGTPVGVNVDGIIQIPNPITCADVIVNINGELWAEVPSGDTENIIVRQSTGSTEVGEIQGAYYRIADSVAVLKDTAGTIISSTDIKAEDSEDIVAPDSTITVNGGAFDTVVSGGTLDVEVEYETSLDNPIQSIVGNKIIIIDPVVCPSDLIYQEARYTGQVVSYGDGDATWRKDNDKLLAVVQPEKGIAQRLQNGSNYLLLYDNVFGNKYMVTGLTGGYYNPLDGNYYDVTNSIVTRADAFPDEIGVDHLYNRLVQTLQDGTKKTWFDWLADGLTLTMAGFSEWYLPTINEGVAYADWSTTLPFQNSVPFEWGSQAKFLSDTYLGSGTTQCYTMESYGQIRSISKTNTYKAIYIKPIDINSTFG